MLLGWPVVIVNINHYSPINRYPLTYYIGLECSVKFNEMCLWGLIISRVGCSNYYIIFDVRQLIYCNDINDDEKINYYLKNNRGSNNDFNRFYNYFCFFFYLKTLFCRKIAFIINFEGDFWWWIVYIVDGTFRSWEFKILGGWTVSNVN